MSRTGVSLFGAVSIGMGLGLFLAWGLLKLEMPEHLLVASASCFLVGAGLISGGRGRGSDSVRRAG